MIILGDWNDDVIRSTVDNLVTPFIEFVQDPDYHFVTESLTRAGQASYRSRSMIDHILIARPLFAYHIDGAERVVRQTGIVNYESTTSDHYPVETRFDFTRTSTSTAPAFLPEAVSFSAYPSPARTHITLQAPVDVLRFEVSDALGRRVYEGGMESGSYTLPLAGWAPGVYLIRWSPRDAAGTRTFVVQP